ncbi:MAG: YgaP family membrane protein [Armatimonadota bacterium]
MTAKRSEHDPSASGRPRRFFDKNIGPVERMVRAIVGVLIMAVGLLGFDAQKINGNVVGLVLVLIGFLVFLQAPMSWCPLHAIRGHSTYEKEE